MVIRKASDDDIYKRASLLSRDSVHGSFDGRSELMRLTQSWLLMGIQSKLYTPLDLQMLTIATMELRAQLLSIIQVYGEMKMVLENI